MMNFERIQQLIKEIFDKNIQLNEINKVADASKYNNLQEEITKLNAELQDLMQIDTADNQMAINKLDKNIDFLEQQIDFENLEPDEYRALAKIQDLKDHYEKEINDIIEDANKLGKPEDKNVENDEEID